MEENKHCLKTYRLHVSYSFAFQGGYGENDATCVIKAKARPKITPEYLDRFREWVRKDSLKRADATVYICCWQWFDDEEVVDE